MSTHKIDILCCFIVLLAFSMTNAAAGTIINLAVTSAPFAVRCPLITREFIGIYDLVQQGIEDHEGHGITLDRDLLGTARNATHPAAGPFEALKVGATNTFTITAGPVDTPHHV